jgi:hypothetical protein
MGALWTLGNLLLQTLNTLKPMDFILKLRVLHNYKPKYLALFEMQWILFFWSSSGEDLPPKQNVVQRRKNK